VSGEKRPEHESVKDETQKSPFPDDVFELLFGALTFQTTSQMMPRCSVVTPHAYI